MNYLERIEIFGFWGTKHVLVDLYRDVNFLIGPNGSGKTTIINLIAAVLGADTATLYSVQFDRILISLVAIGSNRKPTIEVEKIVDTEINVVELHYTIREKRSAKGISFRIESPNEERVYHDPRRPKSRRLREDDVRLGRILSQIVEVNWLSVHRIAHDNFRRVYREEEFESSVDRKLREISRSFSNYFSLLSSRAEKEGKLFQENIFLSLLAKSAGFEVLIDQIDEEPAEKSVIVGVLTDLGVTNIKANRSATDHLSRLAAAKSRGEEGLTLDDAILFSDAVRVGDMIKRWNDLQETSPEIPRRGNRLTP